MPAETLETTCCIVGGGPAGMMLGYLLARAGVPVTVLEKHNDFFRDFRGDTVHPSTLQVLDELGLLEAFLKVPHQQLTSVGGTFGDFPFQAANFSRVPGPCKFIALMPKRSLSSATTAVFSEWKPAPPMEPRRFMPTW
jgi:2-polyprenyl-6-methoxyphenol hydroxylase-like FAD-dependent oxidoreductase